MEMLGFKAMQEFSQTLEGAPVKVVMWAVRNVYEPGSYSRCDAYGIPYSIGTIPDYRQYFVLPAVLEHSRREPTASNPCIYDMTLVNRFAQLRTQFPCFAEDMNRWLGCS